MPKPVCVKCEVEFKLEHSGVVVVEMFQKDKDIYKIWQADLWKCPKCGTEIVYGFGDKPLMEHWQGDINHVLSVLKKKNKKIVNIYENINNVQKKRI